MLLLLETYVPRPGPFLTITGSSSANPVGCKILGTPTGDDQMHCVIEVCAPPDSIATVVNSLKIHR